MNKECSDQTELRMSEYHRQCYFFLTLGLVRATQNLIYDFTTQINILTKVGNPKNLELSTHKSVYKYLFKVRIRNLWTMSIQ